MNTTCTWNRMYYPHHTFTLILVREGRENTVQKSLKSQMHISHLSLDLHQPSLLSSLSSLSHGRKLMLETGFLFTFFAIASSPVQEFDNNSPHFFTRICNGKLKIKTTYNIYIFRFRIFLFKKSQEMSRENEENE